MSLQSYFSMSHNQCHHSTQLKLPIARYSALKSQNHRVLEVERVFGGSTTAHLLHFNAFSGYVLLATVAEEIRLNMIHRGRSSILNLFKLTGAEVHFTALWEYRDRNFPALF